MACNNQVDLIVEALTNKSTTNEGILSSVEHIKSLPLVEQELWGKSAGGFYIKEDGWTGTWRKIGQSGLFSLYDIKQTKNSERLTGKGKAYIGPMGNYLGLYAEKYESSDGNTCSYQLPKVPGYGIFAGNYTCSIWRGPWGAQFVITS